ncbi:PAP2 family protein [Bacteroides sp. 214]|uniref:phosphatase PAP2 family protein n=1 Tax=Bacteroides sp. 214 TaxID=2302935 RepID=UPI0013D6EDCF|nr:phosphatase PAP2 family protein [Bacteroides sp. 214]NDW13274.1 PAP2 family protein [Bacteroides sp. 214]
MQKILFILCFLPTIFVSSQNWDINTLKKINNWDNGFIRNSSKVLSSTTPYVAIGVPAVMAIYGGIVKNEPLLKNALYVGSSVFEAIVLTYSMKYMIDRERPFEKYPDKIDPRHRPSSSSFPSAHTAMAFSLATSLSIKYPKWYVIAPSATWACAVGIARLNDGVHYPSDVIAGAVVGAGCAVVNIYINHWMQTWLFPQKKTATNNIVAWY